MPDIRQATVVEIVDAGELDRDFIEDVRSLVYQRRVEYALLHADDGRLLLVTGGYDGIALIDRDGSVGLEVYGRFVPVRALVWHVHPEPTGPSQHDFDVIERLGQASSILYEVNAAARGRPCIEERSGDDRES